MPLFVRRLGTSLRRTARAPILYQYLGGVLTTKMQNSKKKKKGLAALY